jgi:hypothetical protein
VPRKRSHRPLFLHLSLLTRPSTAGPHSPKSRVIDVVSLNLRPTRLTLLSKPPHNLDDECHSVIGQPAAEWSCYSIFSVFPRKRTYVLFSFFFVFTRGSHRNPPQPQTLDSRQDSACGSCAVLLASVCDCYISAIPLQDHTPYLPRNELCGS